MVKRFGDPYGGGDFVIEPPTNEDVQLNDNPHYSDPLFREAQTIFGAREEGLNYVYSDRLVQWDSKAHRRAEEIADSKVGRRVSTAKWYRVYLSEYYGKPVELPHIMAGCNLASGYPYQVFGFREI